MEYVGLLFTVFSWLAGAFLLLKWRGTHEMSISRHAASSRKASLLFATVMCGIGGIFYYWILVWLTPELGLGWEFQALVILAFIGQFIAGLVPDVPGRRRFIHRLGAYGMALLFLPLSLMLTTAPQASQLAQWFGLLCLPWLVFAGIWGVRHWKDRRHYLPIQVAFIVVFQVQILVTAYL